LGFDVSMGSDSTEATDSSLSIFYLFSESQLISASYSEINEVESYNASSSSYSLSVSSSETDLVSVGLDLFHWENKDKKTIDTNSAKVSFNTDEVSVYLRPMQKTLRFPIQRPFVITHVVLRSRGLGFGVDYFKNYPWTFHFEIGEHEYSRDYVVLEDLDLFITLSILGDNTIVFSLEKKYREFGLSYEWENLAMGFDFHRGISWLENTVTDTKSVYFTWFINDLLATGLSLGRQSSDDIENIDIMNVTLSVKF